MVLGHVAAALEDFRYTDELAEDDTVVLRFKARVGDRELEGIDFLELDEDGRVRELTVFMRPMSALNAFNEQMATRLGVELPGLSSPAPSGGVPERSKGLAVNQWLCLRRFESCLPHMSPSLDGRVYAIAGVGGGFGPLVAARFGGAGAIVAGADRDQGGVDALGAELGLPAERWDGRAADLLDEDATRAWHAALLERFGRVDGLLHLVGGWRGGEPLHEAPLADWGSCTTS